MVVSDIRRNGAVEQSKHALFIQLHALAMQRRIPGHDNPGLTRLRVVVQHSGQP